MAAVIHIDISGALAGLEQFEEKLQKFKDAVVRWARLGLQRFVLPKLKNATPFRTGRLRAARQFEAIPRGGSFFWADSGFYYKFQPGLQERHRQIVRDSIPDLIKWVLANARREVGI